MHRYAIICLAWVALASCTARAKPDAIQQIREQIEIARPSHDAREIERLGQEFLKEIELQIDGARKSHDLQRFDRLRIDLFTYREGNPRERVREQIRLGALMWQALDSMAVLTPEERKREPIMGDSGADFDESARDRQARKRRNAEEAAFNARASKQWSIDLASMEVQTEMWLLGIREYSSSAEDAQRLREDLAPFPEPIRKEVLRQVEVWRRTGRH
jgi:hypothetical protein